VAVGFQTRTACCQDPARGCGTRFGALVEWVCKHTGKAVKMVKLTGSQQGGPPFFAQPVGYDGRTFYVAADAGCDTEKVLHDACHYFLASRDRRQKMNCGHGPGHVPRISDEVADNEEVAVALLEELLAPHFLLPPDRMKRPDYNVANRRHLDWDTARTRAQDAYALLLPTLGHLPALAARVRSKR
jgi:hypothetical protein